METLLYINKRTGEFDYLIDAVVTAGLADDLQQGTLTVFAPTDDAFEALLGEDPDFGAIEGLQNILAYHVTAGRISYKAWYKKDELEMLNGDFTELSRKRYRLRINDAKIIYWVIPTSNGNIYVIDKVLLPPAGTPGT